MDDVGMKAMTIWMRSTTHYSTQWNHQERLRVWQRKRKSRGNQKKLKKDLCQIDESALDGWKWWCEWQRLNIENWSSIRTNGSLLLTSWTILTVSSSSSTSMGMSGKCGRKSFWATASWANRRLCEPREGRLNDWTRRSLSSNQHTWRCGVCNNWNKSLHVDEMWHRCDNCSNTSNPTCESIRMRWMHWPSE